ncbi:uncharacterized protein LOC143590729 [Bidens hawaiensis]|uniref:uncharacterized protein LOC143590729 n=1 Tax=Bidens hawaiensis TaxID=980011 RepID=UPI0040490D3B
MDSMLVANQIESAYEAKDDKMASYLAQAKVLMQNFTRCKVKHIKRSENKQVDALSELALVSFDHLAKDIRVEVLNNPSVLAREVCIISTSTTSWMTPIINFLSLSAMPDNKDEAKKILHKALNYQMKEGIMYMRSYLGPLLWCVNPQDANYLLRELHKGLCGIHTGPRMVVAKIMNAGYYWPDMHVDSEKQIINCNACQRYAPNTLRPKNMMIPVT